MCFRICMQVKTYNLTIILEFQRQELPSKYLGIPLKQKPISSGLSEPIVNKLQDRIRKWACRSLNLAVHLMLTKFFLQTIPIFMMSALRAPKGVLQ